MPTRADTGLTFEIAVEGGLDGDKVLALLQLPDVAVLGTAAPGGRWEPDEVRLFDRERLTIRPVEARVGKRTVEVTVFNGASAEDAELAVALAYAIASATNTHVRAPELDEVLAADDFRARHGRLWAHQFERDAFEGLLTDAASGRVELESLRGPLALGPRVVAQARRAPDAPLAARDGLRRLVWIDLEEVHLGHTHVTEYGEREVRVGSWARGVPTLLDATAHAVALEDGHSTLHVPLDALADALDRDAHWLAEDHFVAPALDAATWDALVLRLKARAVSNLEALAGPRVAHASRGAPLGDWTPAAYGALDRSAQNALRAGVVIAVLIIAAADGVIEDAELAAFRAWLDGASKRPGPMSVLFPNGAGDALALLDATTRSKVPVSSLFVTTLTALKAHVARGARHAYADDLRALALHVAEASGGPGWMSFLRSKVSHEERAALDTLDAMLARITAA